MNNGWSGLNIVECSDACLANRIMESQKCKGWYNGDDPNAGRHWAMHCKSRGTMYSLGRGGKRGGGGSAKVTMTRTMTYNQEELRWWRSRSYARSKPRS
ncbi:uncharacterized protein BO87DRAFT_161395 [Aspergillus neoniger CBS 115656]|uniref:Uncharacterized protein n=1 Tax=Aspergillus neoniger (strain CBS 115656) TaxID=1448310 RepID=A0A318Z2I7_ASPNB|nr:hypothetical protein BO87DRAFT_161395 [Aspergillus neoniger CBS 115656]PYH38020.1 hypothetical protein BO87DRAFT_161395 [Aspergillus neoniger CBS 115656]